jgi:CHASE1-domain containing sensor protein
MVAGGIGLALSLSASFAVWHREKQLAELELSARATSYALTLQFGITAYMRKLAGVRALFESISGVSREEFDTFSKQVLSDQTAIVGMSWVPRVTRDQRDLHERAAVRDGLPSYRIKSVASDGTLTPSPDRSEYFPVF